MSRSSISLKVSLKALWSNLFERPQRSVWPRLAIITLSFGASCTPLKDYKACASDEGCPSLTECLPEGLCAPLSEGSLPEGLSLISGSLSSVERAAVVGLLSRAHTPSLNKNVREGVALSAELIPPIKGGRDVIWIEAGAAQGGGDTLLERFQRLNQQRVDMIISPSLTRDELITLQEASKGEGAPLLVLSYDDPQAPPVSERFPSYVFPGLLSEPRERTLPLTLTRALLAHKREGEAQVMVAYDVERSPLEQYALELTTLLKEGSVKAATFPLDRDLSAPDQLSAWEMFGGLPELGSVDLILWIGDVDGARLASLALDLDRAGYLTSDHPLEMISVMGAAQERSGLSSLSSAAGGYRWWSLHPGEYEALPEELLSRGQGRGVAVRWPEGEFEGELEGSSQESIEAFWDQGGERVGRSVAELSLFARGFDVATLLSYVAQYMDEPTPFQSHIALSRLLTASSSELSSSPDPLYPSQSSLLARPSVLDERRGAFLYGLQGRLQFSSQRAFNLPLPYLSCQSSAEPSLVAHVMINEAGDYAAPRSLLEGCLPAE